MTAKFTDMTPEGAALRSEQAHIDADIEGLADDPQLRKMVAEWDAQGIPIEEQIKRLDARFMKTDPVAAE